MAYQAPLANNTVSMYLWVSHGLNVSTQHNYYPIECKFRYVATYAKPFKQLSTKTLDQITQQGLACRLLLGSCPHIPITHCSSRKKYVYLPPLIFGSRTSDHPDIKGYSGLFYLEIEKTGMSKLLNHGIKMDCIIRNGPTSRLMTHDDIITTFGDNKPIPYSQIFRLVYDDCQRNGRDPKNIVMGIYACEELMTSIVQNELSLRINRPTESLVPKYIEPLNIQSKFYTQQELQAIPSNPPTYIYPTTFPLIQLSQWQAILGLKTQGCGLNVLSYFGIMDVSEATEKTACLSTKGSSIFSLVEYTNLKQPNPDGYVVVRYSLETGIQIINLFFNQILPSNYGFFVKIYHDLYQRNTSPQTFSQMGHSIAFGRHNNKNYFTDPQNSIFYEVTALNSNQLFNFISNTYNNYYLYMDIVFSVLKTQPTISTVANFLQVYIQNFKGIIVPKPADINYGGNKQITRKTKSHKKNIRKTRRNKNIKNGKRGGDGDNTNPSITRELDEYEKIMLDIGGEESGLLLEEEPLIF
jgi:hypothetical protein